MCTGSLKKLRHPLILVPFIGGLNVQGQRLKGIYATVFAKGLLHEETGHTAGYIVSAQGAGGILGAAIAGRFATSCASQWWFLVGISVVVLRTWGWTTSVAAIDAGADTNEAAMPFICITFIYGCANMIVTNVMVTLLNSRAQSVEIMGLSRFLVRMSGVLTKAVVTLLTARYELAGLQAGTETDYPALFTTLSCVITACFCLPAFMCFLHMACFSGVGLEHNYEDADEILGDSNQSTEADGENVELKKIEHKSNYGSMDNSSAPVMPQVERLKSLERVKDLARSTDCA